MKVSIVIPCHNVEGLVGHALDSVLAQDHPMHEVILVDDGSTDGTKAVIDQYVHRFPDRVQVIAQANRGAAAARNVGLKASSGTYVQFLDADDVIYPDKISGQVRLAEQEGLPDLVVGDYEQVMPNGLLLTIRALHDKPWAALIRTRKGTTSSALWKRDALMRLGGWNEALASSQDYELMFRLLKNGGRVAWDRRVSTQVLKRPSGSISQTGITDNWRRYISLRCDMKEHLERTDAAGFSAEIELLRQYMFMALRIVAVDDPAWARTMFDRCIGKGFKPQVSKAITERYAVLYNLLGFTGAERVTHWLKRHRTP